MFLCSPITPTEGTKSIVNPIVPPQAWSTRSPSSWGKVVNRNIYYGVAYNGEGVAFAQTAGRLIADLMAGEESEFTKLFVLNHQIPYMGPTSLRYLAAWMQKRYLMLTSSAKTVR